MASHAETLRLPATVVQRIVKDALPANAMVSKEARTAIARAAAVFILNMSTHANDFAQSRKRKQITAEDVYHAVKTVECDKLEQPLKEAVELWKVVKAQKAEDAKKRKSERVAEASGETQESEETPDDVDENADENAEDESQESMDVLQDSLDEEVSQELNEPEVGDIEDM